MKKIFTIVLAAAGTISFASAQSYNHKDVAYNDHQKRGNDHYKTGYYEQSNTAHYNDGYFSNRESESRIENINREFDRKIEFVKNDRHIGWREKSRQINWLQEQRRQEINKVQFQYAGNQHRDNDRHFGHDEHKW